MCNLYSVTSNVEAIRQIARHMREIVGNFAPRPGVFPDYSAPIVRNASDGVRELAMARWGMPSSQRALMESAQKRARKLEAKGKAVYFTELLRMEPDIGTTNIRNVASKHWRRWLGRESRCVVPFTSFSENEVLPSGARPPVWFARDESRPLMFFAGIWTNWTSVRKARTGEETIDVFGFLTTDPNAEVAPFHPKAMPVILTTPEEIETWMTAPKEEALKLQRALPDGSLRIVARGEKKDGALAEV
jgi:putative SOS response-associated peptidase YedK